MNLPTFSRLKSKPKKKSTRSKKQAKWAVNRKLGSDVGLKRSPETVIASYSSLSHFHFYQNT
jgi:hypothetical protein